MSEWGGHTRETRKATQVAPTRVLGTGVVKGTWDLRSWGRVTWETGVEEGPEECPNRSNRKKRFLRIFVPSKARATTTNAEHGDEEDANRKRRKLADITSFRQSETRNAMV